MRSITMGALDMNLGMQASELAMTGPSRLEIQARRARRCVRAVFKICVETVVILAVAWQHGTAQIAVHNEVFVGSSF